MELPSIIKVSLDVILHDSNTGSIRDDPYWISRKNSLELMELSSITKVSLDVILYSNTGSIRNYSY
jgi:hypothetical protein